MQWQYVTEWIKEHKQQFLLYGGIVFLLVTIGIIFSWRWGTSSHKAPVTPRVASLSTKVATSPAPEAKRSSPTKEAALYVDIKGAVKHPGVYKIASNERVSTVIQRAGGLLEQADLQQVNLAQKLADQAVIYIPRVGEETVGECVTFIEQPTTATTPAPTSGATSTSTAEGKVNLNTASKDDLTKLTGIGPKKAEQILAYRQEHGAFKSIDEIKQVSGIGEKTFTSIKDQLTI
ncbi:helix-hairpin-helix domain-containing protein [Ligilactobacillus saerimneri]|uniref:helix-hairpin-helix domain-containing protein n=1 Tax=Ligilactobacillus saerimneri TaxID=228229 RepID=UPI00209FE38C|nr:helix-hairpin-helix domain-containing protein [Ligilactobacillus saerimneri]